MHLEEESVVQNHLRRGHSEVQDLIVDSARGLDRAQALLQVAVERPELVAAVEAALECNTPLPRSRYQALNSDLKWLAHELHIIPSRKTALM